MKNTLKRLLALFLFTSALFFYFACENNSTVECETCQSEDYTLTKVEIFNSELEFKKFDNEKGDFHFFHKSLNINDLGSSIEKFISNYQLNINTQNIIGLCLITDNSKKSDSNNTIINDNDIEGIILYSLNNKNNLNIRFLKKHDNQFLENEISNIEIGYISTNHIYDFTDLFFGYKEKNAFLLVDKKYSTNENINNKKLNDTLDQYYLQNRNINRKVAPRTCGPGCTTNDGTECGLDNKDNYFCREDPNCPEEEAEQTLRTNNIFTYDYELIADDLHYFRGNYLKTHTGGQKIIDDYYELGRNLPLSFFSIENCNELFGVITNDVLPIVNDLSENPTSESILIDNQLKIRLTNYLTSIKSEYTDQNSKNKIDNIIDKINLFSNKSNKYITDNLHLY